MSNKHKTKWQVRGLSSGGSVQSAGVDRNDRKAGFITAGLPPEIYQL